MIPTVKILHLFLRPDKVIKVVSGNLKKLYRDKKDLHLTCHYNVRDHARAPPHFPRYADERFFSAPC